MGLGGWSTHFTAVYSIDRVAGPYFIDGPLKKIGELSNCWKKSIVP